MSPIVAAANKRDHILDTAIQVVGHFGLKKTSVDELAKAAGLSKQGLYLYFASKDELFAAAMRRYLDEGLRLVGQALDRKDAPLHTRLVDALDAWFGRHLAHFNPATLEVIEPRDTAASHGVKDVKTALRALLARSIARSPEYRSSRHVCSPAELADVLFQFGLTWKEGHASRAAFRETLDLCVRACCQFERPAKRAGGRAKP